MLALGINTTYTLHVEPNGVTVHMSEDVLLEGVVLDIASGLWTQTCSHACLCLSESGLKGTVVWITAGRASCPLIPKNCCMLPTCQDLYEAPHAAIIGDVSRRGEHLLQQLSGYSACLNGDRLSRF